MRFTKFWIYVWFVLSIVNLNILPRFWLEKVRRASMWNKCTTVLYALKWFSRDQNKNWNNKVVIHSSVCRCNDIGDDLASGYNRYRRYKIMSHNSKTTYTSGQRYGITTTKWHLCEFDPHLLFLVVCSIAERNNFDFIDPLRDQIEWPNAVRIVWGPLRLKRRKNDNSGVVTWNKVSLAITTLILLCSVGFR